MALNPSGNLSIAPWRKSGLTFGSRSRVLSLGPKPPRYGYSLASPPQTCSTGSSGWTPSKERARSGNPPR